MQDEGSPQFPQAGAFRVHPTPDVLFPPRPDEPPLNRFDDPEGDYAVRYLATNLRGCLIEVFARFRPSASAEQRIDAVTIGPDEPAPPAPEQGVSEWLAAQWVGRARLMTTAPVVSVNDAVLLAELNNHPRVRTALAAAGLRELDEAAIRLGGDRGRPVTQAVSRAVYERDPRPAGLGYRSRLDDAEPCWALFGHAKVVFDSQVPLSPEDGEHRRAVQDVAGLLGVPLPAHWRD